MTQTQCVTAGYLKSVGYDQVGKRKFCRFVTQYDSKKKRNVTFIASTIWLDQWGKIINTDNMRRINGDCLFYFRPKLVSGR